MSLSLLKHEFMSVFFIGYLTLLFIVTDFASYRETIYRSYPLMKTKNATWERITSLDVKLLASSPTKLRFRITVFNCDIKGANHLLIGISEVYSVDLARQTGRLLPIRRNDKVKGFIRLVHFQLDSV